MCSSFLCGLVPRADLELLYICHMINAAITGRLPVKREGAADVFDVV